jgi:hypothetical protein
LVHAAAAPMGPMTPEPRHVVCNVVRIDHARGALQQQGVSCFLACVLPVAGIMVTATIHLLHA